MAEGWKQWLQDRQGASSRGPICLERPLLPTGSASWKSSGPNGRVDDLWETCAASETLEASRGGRPGTWRWAACVRGRLGLSQGLAAVSPWDLVTWVSGPVGQCTLLKSLA